MKKYFSLIAVAMLAVSSVFTSCSKDDAGSSYNPSVEPSNSSETTNSEVDVILYTCVTTSQTNYFNQTYTLNLNGTTKTVSLAEMTEVTDDATKKAMTFYESMTSSYKTMHSNGDFNKDMKFYSYDCGKMTTGTMSVDNVNLTLKENLPEEVELDYVYCSEFAPTINGVRAEISNATRKIGNVTMYGMEITKENTWEDQLASLNKNQSFPILKIK